MNWRKTVQRSAVIVCILLLSVLCGFLYSVIGERIDRVRYPRQYAEYVTEYASEYGVPEYIVYSVIRTESGFQSNAESDAGAIGLMQLTPDTFRWVNMLRKENTDTGMMYDPQTNIDYGTYLLSYYYMRYNDWDLVFAAYNAGMTQLNTWLSNPEYTDEEGNLKSIPFKETEKYIKKVNDAIEVYRRLYYNS